MNNSLADATQIFPSASNSCRFTTVSNNSPRDIGVQNPNGEFTVTGSST